MNPLAAWLTENDKTQAWLAEKIGITASYVSLLCRAPPEYFPSGKVLRRICDLTGISADALLPPAEAAE